MVAETAPSRPFWARPPIFPRGLLEGEGPRRPHKSMISGRLSGPTMVHQYLVPGGLPPPPKPSIVFPGARYNPANIKYWLKMPGPRLISPSTSGRVWGRFWRGLGSKPKVNVGKPGSNEPGPSARVSLSPFSEARGAHVLTPVLESRLGLGRPWGHLFVFEIEPVHTAANAKALDSASAQDQAVAPTGGERNHMNS